MIAKISTLAFSALAFTALSCGGNSSSSSSSIPAGAVQITIPSSAATQGSAAFGSNPLHVAVGAQVVWVNSDSVAHTATADNGSFNTGSISQSGGDSSAVTFNAPGTYTYHCNIHPGMTGTIIVP